jgi:DHA2 family multidrug resistance protein-like MFS transporter
MTTVVAPAGVSNARKWGTVAIGCLAVLVLNIDMTALNLAIPNLIADLHPSSAQILWIADMYGFVLAGLLIPMGYLGDRIGRKRLLLAGTALFAAASAVAAYSPSAELLIATRALMGVAGATIMPSTLSLTRNVFTDPKERTAAVGMGAGIGALGVGLGPVLGGLLLDHFWWGSVFVINLPIMAVVLVAGAIVLPESRDPRPGRFDLVSVPLSIAGVLALVYAVTEAGRGNGGEPQVWGAAIAGAVAFGAFLLRQTRLADPLIDIRLFRDAAFAGSVSANLLAMFTLVAQSLVFSQYFQQVWGWSPLVSGLAGLPGSLSAMVGGAVLAGPAINALGRARTVGLGLVLAGSGFGLYTLTGTKADYWVLLAVMIPGPLGIGMALTVTSDTILASIPKERAGAASAISETATEFGGALGLAVLGSVLTAVYRAQLTGPQPPGVRDSLGAALETAKALPARTAAQVIGAARQAYVDGMHAALYCSAALAVLTGVYAWVALRRVPKVITDPA